VAAAGRHPLAQVRQGVQRIYGQAHPVRSIPSMTGPMTVVSFIFLSTARWAALSRCRARRIQVLRRFLAFELGIAGRLAVGAQAAQRGDVAGVAVGRGGQHRVPRGNRDAAGSGADREFRAAAGDGCRAGRDGGGCLPLLPGGFADLLA